jgi:hypothetical protein
MVLVVVGVRGADGVEVVRGTLRAGFVAGQRQAVLHVGFCPPLEGLPVVEAFIEPTIAKPSVAANLRQAAGMEVRVVQAFCHGARLEVRLGEAATEEFAVVVGVSARPQKMQEGMARG